MEKSAIISVRSFSDLNKDEVIEVRKAVNVEIVSKDKTISIMTAEPTIGAMLEAESDELNAEGIGRIADINVGSNDFEVFEKEINRLFEIIYILI